MPNHPIRLTEADAAAALAAAPPADDRDHPDSVDVEDDQ